LYINLYVHDDAHICISLFKIVFDKKIVSLQGDVMLPNMFVGDCGDHIGRYATMVNPNNNEFEVLMKRFNDSVF